MFGRVFSRRAGLVESLEGSAAQVPAESICAHLMDRDAHGLMFVVSWGSCGVEARRQSEQGNAFLRFRSEHQNARCGNLYMLVPSNHGRESKFTTWILNLVQMSSFRCCDGCHGDNGATIRRYCHARYNLDNAKVPTWLHTSSYIRM